jgi:hypothetical protein
MPIWAALSGLSPPQYHDDPARGSLPEHLCQAHHGHYARADDVSQHLAGADGGQLVDIADDNVSRHFGARTRMQ